MARVHERQYNRTHGECKSLETDMAEFPVSQKGFFEPTPIDHEVVESVLDDLLCLEEGTLKESGFEIEAEVFYASYEM